jgi:uncharacterized membrane protein YfcA
MRAAEAFERQVKQGGDVREMGVRLLQVSWARIVVRFGNEQFAYRPWQPVIAGMAIAVLSSALGVGGGFLLVPFMSIIMRLPMYVIAGTSALAILLHSITSIGNYLRMGVGLDYPLLGFLLAGVIVGSAVGPVASRYLPEKILRVLLCLVLIFIGLRYVGLF